MAASYPTSLKSFTTKVDNVTDVLAAHVNDIQDEVVAIETALGISWKGVVKVSTVEVTSVVTCGTTGTTYDDTVPAISDGVEILTLAHTALASANLLYFIITGHAGCNSGANHSLHLHKDGGNGVSATAFNIGNNSNSFTLAHSETAGDTSSHTWSVRLNPSSGGNTSYLNGNTAGTRLFGGVSSSKMIILEVKV